MVSVSILHSNKEQAKICINFSSQYDKSSTTNKTNNELVGWSHSKYNETSKKKILTLVKVANYNLKLA